MANCSFIGEPYKHFDDREPNFEPQLSEMSSPSRKNFYFINLCYKNCTQLLCFGFHQLTNEFSLLYVGTYLLLSPLDLPLGSQSLVTCNNIRISCPVVSGGVCWWVVYGVLGALLPSSLPCPSCSLCPGCCPAYRSSVLALCLWHSVPGLSHGWLLRP